MSMVTESFADGARGALPACAASIARTFADHIPLYACAFLFCAATLAIGAVWHVPLSPDASLFFLKLVPTFLMIGLSLGVLHRFAVLVLRERPARPLAVMGEWLLAFLTGEDRAGNVFHSVVTLTPLMMSFAALKEVIPAIHPFSWDTTFVQWDRAIGFGRLPWQILQPWLGYPLVTTAINSAYDAWFLTMFAALFWQAFARRASALRMQFLVAFSFAWFLAGNVLAVIFSSAGPCYYGRLHPGIADPYAAQMVYLRAVAAHWPVWSIQVQDMLWHSYATGHGEITGISAMPSLHVTVAVLLMLLGWCTNRWLGAVMSVFAGLVVIGSIHLAWHYAVDGIAGAGLAVFFWWAAALLVRANTLRFGAGA
jgi:PAP2 superfamily